MEPTAQILLTLGGILLLGLASDVLGRRTFLPRATSHWIGVAMLPQAGAAMGMALVATSLLPEYRQVVLSVVISTTVFFELVGPLFTRLALRRAAGS